MPGTVIVDDATGTASGVPLPPQVMARLKKEGLPAEAPARNNGYGVSSQYNNGFGGDVGRAGRLLPNAVQQQWFADVTSRAVLPLFEAEPEKPFAIVFWSRDPDGTQHNQTDSLGTLFPGTNGETSRLAVRNADGNLRQLLDWLDAHPAVKANTDVVVTSDRGFATISRREVDRNGRVTSSEGAKHFYLAAGGKLETDKGMLPNGFLVIDLAIGLKTNLFDPDRRVDGVRKPYKQVRLGLDAWEHPAFGNGLRGNDVEKGDGSDALAILAANGGSDLIYVPGGGSDTMRRIMALLLSYDYVGGIFVDEEWYGKLPGALSLGEIGLRGSSGLPQPAIAVAIKVFYLNSA